MTNEEASYILANIDRRVCDDELNEALDMAIKALEQQPCGDAVSREAVGYYIQSYIHEIITESGTDKNEHTNSILRAILDGIKTMPSVQPTRPIGKWTEIGIEGLVFECSICGTKKTIESHFCPNCGARMTESEEEE